MSSSGPSHVPNPQPLPAAEPKGRWIVVVWFVGWAVVGAALAAGFERKPIIGVLVVPFAIAAAITLGTRPGGLVGLPGLLTGGGAVMLWIAYVNRAGPGLICSALSKGSDLCRMESSPRPWWIAGSAAVLLGLLGFVVATGRNRGPVRRQPGA